MGTALHAASRSKEEKEEKIYAINAPFTTHKSNTLAISDWLSTNLKYLSETP